MQIYHIHHIHKLDAPSGTALTLAESLLDEKYFSEWELDGKTDKKLNIESVREREVPGTHSITYQSQVDSISIQHEAFNRDGFALDTIFNNQSRSDHFDVDKIHIKHKGIKVDWSWI